MCQNVNTWWNYLRNMWEILFNAYTFSIKSEIIQIKKRFLLNLCLHVRTTCNCLPLLFKETLFKEGVYEVELVWWPENAGWFGTPVSPERDTKWHDRILTNKDLGHCQSVSIVLLQCSSTGLSICKGWLTAGHDLQEWLAGTVTYNLGLCDTNGSACKTALAKWPGWWMTVR